MHSEKSLSVDTKVRVAECGRKTGMETQALLNPVIILLPPKSKYYWKAFADTSVFPNWDPSANRSATKSALCWRQFEGLGILAAFGCGSTTLVVFWIRFSPPMISPRRSRTPLPFLLSQHDPRLSTSYLHSHPLPPHPRFIRLHHHFLGLLSRRGCLRVFLPIRTRRAS
jgi:hypothetical protein